MNKTCRKCFESLPLDQYHKQKGNADGLRNTCKVCRSAQLKAYRKTPKGKIANRAYTTSDKFKESQTKYRLSEKGKAKTNRYNTGDKAKASKKKYRQSDHGRGITNKCSADRRARIRQQTLNLTADQVLWLEWHYKMAVVYEELTGIKHHVDHIHPISKGGLHVPWNLQILTAEENIKKGAKT